MGLFEFLSFFRPGGWGAFLLDATLVTACLAVIGIMIGAMIGGMLAYGLLSGDRFVRGLANAYTMMVRGVPDLLIIYLFYFGGSAFLSFASSYFGLRGFMATPAFATGVLALGGISGAYQAEVYRGAYAAISRGEIEAAQAAGMPRMILFRRIIVPQILRYALPGLGNVWQIILKDSALISVIGVVELLRASTIAAGSTGQPFVFYVSASLLYLAISTLSAALFRKSEKRALRGLRRH
jgi:octopine/nopaline transport system permease protein